MASGSYTQVYVKCPFYHRDDSRNKITCEGVVDGSTLDLNFRCKKDMKQQLDLFCCEYYKNCEVYRMLMENKY